MDIQELLDLADDTLFLEKGQHLDDLQRAILNGTYQGLKYPEIAKNCHRHKDYVKKEAWKLWQILSKRFGEKVAQSNFKSIVEKYPTSHITGELIQIVSGHIVCGNNLHSAKNGKESDKSLLDLPKNSPYLDLSKMPQMGFFNPRPSPASLPAIQEIINENCQLLAILGIAGSGKTSLAVHLVQQLQSNFDFVIWRSLLYPPSLTSLKNDLNQIFKKQKSSHLPSLIDYLKAYRCLLIFDDVQTLFTGKKLVGVYQSAYQDYQDFWSEISNLSHQSCLIIISQEMIPELDTLRKNDRPIHLLHLNSLDTAAESILARYNLSDPHLWSDLINTYSGHPLWLNIIAQTISDECGGSIAEFITDDQIFLGDIRNLLDRTINRLSDPEKELISYLATTDTSITISEICQKLNLGRSNYREIIQSLKRRYLITTSPTNQQMLPTILPVIKQYFKCNTKLEEYHS